MLSNIYRDADLFKESLLEHLWIFELAETTTAEDKKMEARIKKVIEDLDPELTDEQRDSRFDLVVCKKATFGENAFGEWVIIELKKLDCIISVYDLCQQMRHYRQAVSKLLQESGRNNERVEFVCLVEEPLKESHDIDGYQIIRATLATVDAQIKTYTRVINIIKKSIAFNR